MDIFNCTECDNFFYQKRYLSAHIKRVHKKEAVEDPENKKRFRCNYCEKEFNSKNSESKHRIRTHGKFHLQRNIQCQEIDCTKQFSCLHEFRIHLKDSHSFQNQDLCEEKTFNSKTDFEKWLAEEQQNSKCNFVLSRGEKKTSSHIRKVYNCSRSGHFESQSKGDRQLKAQGSKKVGYHCTAQIVLKDYKDHSAIQYFYNHYKHDFRLNHLPLFQETKDIVAGKLGVSMDTFHLQHHNNSMIDRERYRNPPAPLGYQNENLPSIVRRASDTEGIQNFQEWIALGIFEDEDVSIYDHFIINSDSEVDDVDEVPFEPKIQNVKSICISEDEKFETIPLNNIKEEKEEIKRENQTKDIENTEQRINLNRKEEVKITEERTEKKPLVKDDDFKRKEVTEKNSELRIEATKAKSTEQRTDKKPPDKTAEFVIEKRTDECKEKAPAKHREKKTKREDEGNKRKKIKHKIHTCDSDKSSRKKSKLLTRDDDSDFEIEEGEIRRGKLKNYHSPSPTDDCHEDYKKDSGNVQKEYDDCVHPATNIKQEFPSVHGGYYCDICNLTLNSLITYQSHVSGKKHKKNLNAKNVTLAVFKSDVPTEPTSKCPNHNGTNDNANIPSTSSTQDHSSKMPSASSKPTISSSNLPSTNKQGADFSELFKLYSHPDPSKAGFYCSICNSYSNSSSMWEAHIIGKRHIANLKKAPGTAPSKSRNVPAPPGTVARLNSQLKDVYEPIVGLDQIREIQRLDTDSVSYTCFLCGGNLICEDEIVDHILLTKHREKYLEKISYPELDTFRNCQMSVRCSVIAELCERVEAEQGRGEPEVYYAKNSVLKV